MELITERESGCKHPERPILKNCYRCGKGICYECSMKLPVDSQVVSWWTGVVAGKEVKVEYGFFCPYCFLDECYNNRDLPKKPVRTLRNFGIATLGLLIFWAVMSNLIGGGPQFKSIIFGILFGISEIIFALPIYMSKYKKKKIAYKNFKSEEEKALRLSIHDLDK